MNIEYQSELLIFDINIQCSHTKVRPCREVLFILHASCTSPLHESELGVKKKTLLLSRAETQHKETRQRIIFLDLTVFHEIYRSADKSLARPRAKNPLEKFSPRFFGIKTASSSLIIVQRVKLSTRSITHLCWFGRYSLFPSWSG
jgi:hypothetical protein